MDALLMSVGVSPGGYFVCVYTRVEHGRLIWFFPDVVDRIASLCIFCERAYQVQGMGADDCI